MKLTYHLTMVAMYRVNMNSKKVQIHGILEKKFKVEMQL